MKISKTLTIGLGLALAGCPGDDSSSTDTTTSTTDMATGSTGEPMTTGMDTSGDDTAGSESGEPPGACLGTSDMGAAVGDACTANEDCMSGVCTIYTDVPLNADAVCAETPANCGTRVTGTVFDFVTGEPVESATVIVAAALQAATNPTGAMAIVEDTSGADGRIDATSDMTIVAPLGIVALSSGAGYYLTSTGVASPGPDMQTYAVGTGIHDLWMVPEDAVADWSDALGMDPEIDAADLPLGAAGGVVGLVRDSSGNPIAGAVVSSTSDTSMAVVRYLNDDGSFNNTETSELGMFVILNPSVPEGFEASVGGMVVGGGTAGSANNVLFTLIINAP